VSEGDHPDTNSVDVRFDRPGEEILGANAVDGPQEVDAKRRLSHEHDLVLGHRSDGADDTLGSPRVRRPRQPTIADARLISPVSRVERSL